MPTFATSTAPHAIAFRAGCIACGPGSEPGQALNAPSHPTMLRDPPAGASSTPRTSVAISFGSPAGESGVTRLDLNDILIRHPQAAFLMRIAGSSMREAGVDDGDLALVDRAMEAVHGRVVIAVLDDEFVCRRLVRKGSEVRLQAADPACADWVANEGEPLQIWGVVTHVIKPLAVA